MRLGGMHDDNDLALKAVRVSNSDTRILHQEAKAGALTGRIQYIEADQAKITVSAFSGQPSLIAQFGVFRSIRKRALNGWQTLFCHSTRSRPLSAPGDPSEPEACR